jgi:superfamily II DNA or RNA helicase
MVPSSLQSVRRVARSFGPDVAARAIGYIDRVRDIERHGDWINATVVGRRRYHVELFTDEEGVYYSSCSCPVEVDCKHGAALALFIDDSGEPGLDAWIRALASAAVDPAPPADEYSLLYVLAPQANGSIRLEPRKSKPRKRGGWRSGSAIRDARHRPDWLGDEDFARLDRAMRLDTSGAGLWGGIEVGDFDAEFIGELASTGRLLWGPTHLPLRGGGPRRELPVWQWHREDEGYRLGFAADLIILRARTSHYIDRGRGEIGPLELDSKALARALINPPVVPPNRFAQVRSGLDRLAGRSLEVRGGPGVEELEPPPDLVPELSLEIRSTRRDLSIKRSFRARYGDRAIELGATDAGDGARDLISEAIARRRAEALLGELDRYRTLTDEQLAEHIGERVAPLLAAEGWNVEITGDLDIAPPELPDTWFEDAVEEPGSEWFYYSLGIEHQGERTDLIPFLLGALTDARLDLGAVARGECPGLTLELAGGARIFVPGERLVRWLGPLVELNLRGLDKGKLRLPTPVMASFEGGLSRAFAEQPALVRVRQRLEALVELGPRPTPPGLRGELRNYQRRGLAWLRFLHDAGYGGVLADDMGLGKTVQLLALLEELRAEGGLERPALVIAPLSVVHNWRREAARFTPELEVRVHHGPVRAQRPEELDGAHLIITSYQTLARDAGLFRQLSLTSLIADEAQAIKNARTKTWKAVASLEAGSRFCVTGTPVENKLMELWSQTQITMPGLLGTADRFGRMSRRIERGNESFEPVRRRLRPFFLRRAKADVDVDLPPKAEIVERVELGPAQSDLYESLRLMLDKKVRDALEKRGVKGSVLVILDALLRLRQTCCDPRLVDAKGARAITESAKLERLLEMLDELIAAGRSALVFSQFASMLDLIEQACQTRGIDTLKLTGKTRDRDSLIARFQAGEAPVFLISLKAGGTGINLTRADTVIHYDPWWNPAVEAQATDRVHRIGQDKPVFVYKLIAANTLEEKVLELQDRKRALSDLALSEAGVSHFSANDIAALFESL